MHTLTFAPLEIDASRVCVSWRVEPPTPLYARTNFTLEFGDAFDPRVLPLKLWWTVVLICLHSHWNILRPCRIVLPVTLPEREIEFWMRLLDNQRRTLEIHRGTTDFARTIEIECRGELLAVGDLPAPVNRYATAFSGGKDSLLQTALLCEFSSRPLLVNTFAPMPPFRDHLWPFRQRTLDEIVKRRAVELVVVKSDLRRTWSDYEFPHTRGYNISLSMMSDPLFYAANTLVVAASRGIRRTALASEFECTRLPQPRVSDETRGFEFSYSRVNLSALDCLLKQWDLSLVSLLSPFTHYQIEQLVRVRYPDLADLQISCWAMTDDNQQYCSHCLKCFRIAMCLLAFGQDPASLGINLETLIHAQKDYDPKWDEVSGDSVRYAAAQIDLRYVRGLIPARNLWQRLGWQSSESFQLFKSLVTRIASDEDAWLAQSHWDYFKFVPDEFRDALMNLSRTYWGTPDEQDHTTELDAIDSTVKWITEPLWTTAR